MGFSNGFPVLSHINEITEIVISFIDITERNWWKENCEIKEQSETANKAKTDFLAIIWVMKFELHWMESSVYPFVDEVTTGKESVRIYDDKWVSHLINADRKWYFRFF
jgi:hypothetical protein